MTVKPRAKASGMRASCWTELFIGCKPIRASQRQQKSAHNACKDSSALGKQKQHMYTDGSKGIMKACGDYGLNQDKSTPHRPQTYGVVDEQYAKSKRAHLSLSYNQVFATNGGREP